eukprot:CAMPEP_0182838680 /NCGR_PEP_ID=MMETSP0006_2-20121128/23443_1 /TAXON_ID=97485 /ORGANISM="Prymnesium parvum, Strain Texoma1" /LENGTH=70 /DNA_ID=CAMNT_0024967741 /DNA_START=34 /DNA_END=246 /DNA_ORIENTATION=+
MPSAALAPAPQSHAYVSFFCGVRLALDASSARVRGLSPAAQASHRSPGKQTSWSAASGYTFIQRRQHDAS